MSSSIELFKEANKYIPGGVNSPVRSFSSVGGEPLYVTKGKGPIIQDHEGKEYIDFGASWGPLILGHSNSKIINAIKEASENGTTFGINTPQEITIAKLICDAIPTIDKVRLVNSGTEATMTALRLARAYTNKSKLVKFEGCYHGHSDAFLVSAGSGLLTNSISSSKGIPAKAIEDTIIIPYNDEDALEKVFEKHGDDIAAVITEPIAGNMGIILPKNSFLQKLRDITKSNNSLLIFDEVITGFRLCYGGYQNICDIKPDLTCLGKIIGGGLPIGAVGGKKEIMDQLSPVGEVYQAGTLSGNPIAVAAGIATLEILKEKNFYEGLEIATNLFIEEIDQTAQKLGFSIQKVGSMFCIYFREAVPTNLEEVKTCNINKFNKFFHDLLKQGVYLSPSQFEANFISQSHTNDILEKASDLIIKSLNKI